jgi:hypothetical protein
MYLLIAGLLALICVPASARAQPAGEISGSVYDQTGASLPGARLTLRGVAGTKRNLPPPATSRFETFRTSREPSARRPRHLPDVLDLRVSSLLISPYAGSDCRAPRD